MSSHRGSLSPKDRRCHSGLKKAASDTYDPAFGTASRITPIALATDAAWRKLHLAADAASGMIGALTLTNQETDDPPQVGALLDQIDDAIGRVTADDAYDGASIDQTITAHGDDIKVVIPPRSTAGSSGEEGASTQRDRHLVMTTERGDWPGRLPPVMADVAVLNRMLAAERPKPVRCPCVSA